MRVLSLSACVEWILVHIQNRQKPNFPYFQCLSGNPLSVRTIVNRELYTDLAQDGTQRYCPPLSASNFRIWVGTYGDLDAVVGEDQGRIGNSELGGRHGGRLWTRKVMLSRRDCRGLD